MRVVRCVKGLAALAMVMSLGCKPATPTPAPHAGAGASAPDAAAMASAKASVLAPIQATTRDDASGTHITIAPPGIEVVVRAASSGNAYVGPKLAGIRDCHNEWDKEFALVANAAMPFENLAAHVGSDPFCGGNYYYDMHIRVYVTGSAVQDVARTIASGGAAEIARLKLGPPKGEQRRMGTRPEFPGWTRVSLRYENFYGDYGGTSNEDFYLSRIGDATVVLAFFYVADPAYVGDGVRIDPIELTVTSVHRTTP